MSVTNRNTYKASSIISSSLSHRKAKGIYQIKSLIIGKASTSNSQSRFFGKTLKSYCKLN